MDTARKPSDTEDEYVSLYGAAEELGISTKTVLARIVEGELSGKKVAGRIVVTRASVRQLKAKLESAAT